MSKTACSIGENCTQNQQKPCANFQNFCAEFSGPYYSLSLSLLYDILFSLEFTHTHGYRQDLPQAALPVFRLLPADFGVFRPAGATSCTDQGQIWQGGPLLPAKFDLDRFRGGGLRPPKLKKFEFSQYNCP